MPKQEPRCDARLTLTSRAEETWVVECALRRDHKALHAGGAHPVAPDG